MEGVAVLKADTGRVRSFNMVRKPNRAKVLTQGTRGPMQPAPVPG